MYRGCDGVAEDFRVGAAQVVAVEERKVEKVAVRDPGLDELQGVGRSGSGRTHQLRIRPGEGQHSAG